ncbi:hypothetical protein REPUB_Repub08aG0158800 [Reevesia pubescens]
MGKGGSFLSRRKKYRIQSQEFTLSFLPRFKAGYINPVNVIGSCNGLLLCCAPTRTSPTVYYICKPLTKQWLALPPVYPRMQYVPEALICDKEGGAKDGNLKISFEFDYNPEGFKRWIDECPGVCKGRLCFGQLLENRSEGFATLRVWHLEDYNRAKWCLKHEVPLNELKSEVTQLVEYTRCTPSPLLGLPSFHPYNENIIYMACSSSIVSCNMERKTLQMVSEIPSDGILGPFYPFELPWWPSPIPSSIN